MQWYTSVIPAMWGSTNGRITVQDDQARPYLKINQHRAKSMAQSVDCLTNNQEALSSNTSKKIKKKKFQNKQKTTERAHV
jgi:hypothetical protein